MYFFQQPACTVDCGSSTIVVMTSMQNRDSILLYDFLCGFRLKILYYFELLTDYLTIPIYIN